MSSAEQTAPDGAGPPQRILLAHNYYTQAGGEDAVVANEQRLLEEHGHRVRLFSVSNLDIVGRWAAIRTALQTPYSFEGRRQFQDVITDFQPDVVHVHNFFPLLSPSIYAACRARNVPVVQTLHNYRLLCAGATLFRDGRACELCVERKLGWPGIRYGCYRGSRPGSAAIVAMQSLHHALGTWHRQVDRYIALTQFAKEVFVRGGLPAARIAVKPNFRADPGPRPDAAGRRQGGLFVGRISVEKGPDVLTEAWRDLDVPLDVIGDGPMEARLRAQAPPALRPLGAKDGEAVAEAMRRAAFLVMPSIWYEGFPMVLVEAYAAGLPVIASRLGSMAELVIDQETGLHFNPGDPADLADKVRWAAAHPDRMAAMGEAARQRYTELYTPARNYQQLLAIYRDADAVARSKGRR